MARRIVADLNIPKPLTTTLSAPAEPLYDPEELYGLIPDDVKKPLRGARGRRADRRRQRPRRVQAALRHAAGLRFRAHPGLSGRHRRQQRHPLFGGGAQGRAFHRIVQSARHPFDFPPEYSRLHGREEIRSRRHRQGRRQDGDRGRDDEGAEIHAHHRRQLRRRQITACAAGAYSPRFLWMWPNGRISIMGGEQAASVLSTIRRDAIEAGGGAWTDEEEEAFKAPIREQYERQGHPYYASARLWDDGVIDPVDTQDDPGAGALRAQRAGRRHPLRRVPDVAFAWDVNAHGVDGSLWTAANATGLNPKRCCSFVLAVLHSLYVQIRYPHRRHGA